MLSSSTGREGRSGDVPRPPAYCEALMLLCPATRNIPALKNWCEWKKEKKRDQPLCILKGKKRASEMFLQHQAAMETNGLFRSFLVLDVGVQLLFYFLKTCTNLPGFLGREERRFFFNFYFLWVYVLFVDVRLY